MKESVYLEKRKFESLKGEIKDNVDICKKILHLYEKEHIWSESLIHIVSVIDNVKPGASFCDYNHNFDEAYEIQNSKVYNTLIECKIPFRVDVYGEIKSEKQPHEIEYKNRIPTYKIARNYNWIKKLPPFHHITKNNSMADIENKYKNSWGDFLGVPDKDCAWMKEENVNTDITPMTTYGQAYNQQVKFENIEYSTLVPYVPYHSKDGLERAIDLGKKYYDACVKFDNLMNVHYATEEASSRMVRLKESGKREIIKCELYEYYEKEHELFNKNSYKRDIFIENMQDKYNFDKKLIKNIIQDIVLQEKIPNLN